MSTQSASISPATPVGTFRVYVDKKEILIPGVSPQTTLGQIIRDINPFLLKEVFKKIPNNIKYMFTTGPPNESNPTPMNNLNIDLYNYNIHYWINSSDPRDGITLKFIIG